MRRVLFLVVLVPLGSSSSSCRCQSWRSVFSLDPFGGNALSFRRTALRLPFAPSPSHHGRRRSAWRGRQMAAGGSEGRRGDAPPERGRALRTRRPSPVRPRPATPPDALRRAAEIDAVLKLSRILIEALRDAFPPGSGPLRHTTPEAAGRRRDVILSRWHDDGLPRVKIVSVFRKNRAKGSRAWMGHVPAPCRRHRETACGPSRRRPDPGRTAAASALARGLLARLTRASFHDRRRHWRHG